MSTRMEGPVLIVDDDAALLEALGQSLTLAGFTPRLTKSFVAAKDHIRPDFAGVVLSDIRMPGRDGLFLLDHAQSVDPDLPVILLTGEGDIPMAVGAIQRGAFDFLEKPCANDTLAEVVGRAMKARALVVENRALKRRLVADDSAAQTILGRSPQAEALRERVRRIAPVEEAVLIQGAPGSGVAKVADVIHRLSARAEGPFARVVAVGLTPAALDAALGAGAAGSLYIDELSALPPETQFALLQALERAGGARVIASCSQTPGLGHGPDQVLPDLFYRLDALRVEIPALKGRPEDIPVMFRDYVRQASARLNLPAPPVTPEVISGLMAQDWPGNAGALMNAATRFVLGLEADADAEEPGLNEKLAQIERSLIVEALQHQGGNSTAAAERLKLPRKTFYDKLARHGIKPEDYRTS